MPDPCLATDWDDLDEVEDECELPEGHKGAHLSRREDGIVVYWVDEGKDVFKDG